MTQSQLTDAEPSDSEAGIDRESDSALESSDALSDT